MYVEDSGPHGRLVMPINDPTLVSKMYGTTEMKQMDIRYYAS